MKSFLTLVAVLALSNSSIAQDKEGRARHYNLDNGVALDGYDPVSYFSGKPLEGKKSIAAEYFGVTYFFASEANRKIFLADPSRYEPAYGGWCAYAMGESGEKVKIDPETFKIKSGKLYLFYNFWGNNTLEDWNADESRLKSSADSRWKKYGGL